MRKNGLFGFLKKVIKIYFLKVINLDGGNVMFSFLVLKNGEFSKKDLRSMEKYLNLKFRSQMGDILTADSEDYNFNIVCDNDSLEISFYNDVEYKNLFKNYLENNLVGHIKGFYIDKDYADDNYYTVLKEFANENAIVIN